MKNGSPAIRGMPVSGTKLPVFEKAVVARFHLFVAKCQGADYRNAPVIFNLPISHLYLFYQYTASMLFHWIVLLPSDTALAPPEQVGSLTTSA